MTLPKIISIHMVTVSSNKILLTKDEQNYRSGDFIVKVNDPSRGGIGL